MSLLTNEEIRAIIERVDRRLGDVAASDRPASALRAQAALAVSDAELGDGNRLCGGRIPLDQVERMAKAVEPLQKAFK